MKQVNLRIEDELLERVDRHRGAVPRNTWILQALRQSLQGPAFPGFGPSYSNPEKGAPGVPEAEPT